jgi:hypothetical protein
MYNLIEKYVQHVTSHWGKKNWKSSTFTRVKKCAFKNVPVLQRIRLTSMCIKTSKHLSTIHQTFFQTTRCVKQRLHVRMSHYVICVASSLIFCLDERCVGHPCRRHFPKIGNRHHWSTGQKPALGIAILRLSSATTRPPYRLRMSPLRR